jgi:propionyl-CoA carboxylase alpha chain
MDAPMRIRKILVANRGEIARRVMRTCRDMGISTVAVYAEPDAHGPFVREADEGVPLGGSTPADSYLRADKLVDAALRTGADAVHPGYGFLSENAGFARRCIDAGLVFVGPPPDAVAAMGSKLAAREVVQEAGVAVLPGIALLPSSDDGLAGAADVIGWPVLVKASAGGGGRGMRIVREPSELATAVASARREAASAFGDDTVFLERYLERPRHVEIQVMADRYGAVVHLFDRECSIQRRHQKLVEECPSPAVDDALRAAMGDAAVRVARAIGYEGAGTVEFVLAPDGGFFFLEMNTRLQVEHPVTELVTGLDLVRLQLLVAQGEPLPDDARHATLHGHAVEVRLYAEDPDHDYLPTPGRISRARFPEGPGLRVDSGVDDGTIVGSGFDALLAKVIAYAPTRAEALQRLAWALLHGVVTNRELLVGVLEHPDVVAGRIDTQFLERHPPSTLDAGTISPADARVAVLAAALAAQARDRAGVPVLGGIPSGWRNNPSQLQGRAFETRTGRYHVGYRLGGAPRFDVNGEVLDAQVLSTRPDAVDLVVDGVRHRLAVHLDGDVAYVDGARGSLTLRDVERFPSLGDELGRGSLVAPMPGTIVRVDVETGEHVAAGRILAVIEAMKMEHQITAPAAGRVAAIHVRAGQTVDAGELLVVLDELGDGNTGDASDAIDEETGTNR